MAAATSDSKTTKSGSDSKVKETKATNFWVQAISQATGAVRFVFTPTEILPKASVWSEYRFADGKFLSSGSAISKPILLPFGKGLTKVKFQTRDQPDEHFNVIEGVAMRVYPEEQNGSGAAK